MANKKNIGGIISKGAKSISRRAKLIASGARNTVNTIKSAAGNVEQSVNILSELALIDYEILQLENYELPTEKNKIENNQQISDQEKQESLVKIEEFYSIKLENLKLQKETLKESYDKLNDNFYGLKKDEEITNIQLLNDKKDEEINNSKNKTRFKPTATDIIDTVSFILSTLLEFISVNNSKIEELVNSTNDIISKAQTKQDIEAAKLLRDTAVNIITLNKKQLESVNQIIQTLQLLATIITPIINIISLLPSLAITGGVIRVLTKLENLINKINPLLSVSSLLLNKLIDNLNYHETRLLQLGNVLDANLSNLSSEEIQNLLNSNRNQLGYLSGYDYKGFKFYIREENDSKFNIKGNKRRYAVALNKDGNEVLQSTSSFTLDPDVLVEELKLRIDKENLVA